MPTQTPLKGRDDERRTLDGLLDAVRAGASRALVIRGEPGVGKTALLDSVVESAPDLRVARSVGVESEMELAFAALHQLCAPMLDRLERLPGPQRDALATVFGRTAGAAPDRFLVALAALTLLSEAAEERPLLCVVDDAQWLDRASAQVLAFVARRIYAESVVMVFATRGPSEELAGLPELVVEGLRHDDARELLGSVITGPLDERVRDRIVAETRGNPLALLELPRGLTPAEVAGGFGVPGALPLSGRIEESFRRRLEALPADTQRLLRVAAAEPLGEPLLVWRAAERLGIGVRAAEPAAAAGLLEIGARVRFRHPLVRSAVARAAGAEEWQSVHGALAEVTDAEVDPERRAWHRAQSVHGPDEDVASELERLAGRAQARGGVAAAAAFLERSAELTLEPSRRAERALAAAQAKLRAGAPDAAEELRLAAAAGPLDELRSVRADLLRAEIAFAWNRGGDAPLLLLEAAKRLEPLDAGLARETYMEAMSAAIFAGRLAAPGGSVLEVAQAVSAAPRPSRPTPADKLLDGKALLVTEGYQAGAPLLREGMRALCGGPPAREDETKWLWLASRVAMELWDEAGWAELSARHVQLARDTGALTVLPMALTLHAGIHVYAGDFATAQVLSEEALEVSAATGNASMSYTDLILAAWRGLPAELSELAAAANRDAASRGEGRLLSAVDYSVAVLNNGLGRYDLALAAARAAVAFDDLAFTSWTYPELVEAAFHQRELELAASTLERLRERTSASGTEWALGIEACSRALLSEGEAADGLYREAIARFGRTRFATHLARARLLYGEWLRRERRRVDAREQLRAAHELFGSMGAEAFADRAARELLASGETARKRTVETSDELTAQESQIAGLARDGLSNPEIGSQLYISPRTVEYHLRKVFTKLDISSRTEL